MHLVNDVHRSEATYSNVFIFDVEAIRRGLGIAASDWTKLARSKSYQTVIIAAGELANSMNCYCSLGSN